MNIKPRYSGLLFACLSILAVSCEKDENDPLIILSGSATSTIELNSSWSEPGWTASDDEDGDLTEDVVVSGDSVNPNLAGTYVRTYTVSDKAGNDAKRTRTVYVVNSSVNRGGTYTVIDSVDISGSQVENYEVELIPSNTKNNVVWMRNFRDKDSLSVLDLKFQNFTMIIIDPQRPNMGAGFEAEVSGAGQVLADQKSIRIGYLVNYDNLPDKTGILRLSKN
jgi:hypothetical protein